MGNLSTLWGGNRIISNTIAPSATTNMRGGHFPPNFELLDSIIAEPTSEPTQLIGSYKWAAGAPTSEPTEYRTSQNFGNVIVAPTSEPTEYIRDDEDPINLPPPHALAAGNTPTLEPTMFNANSAEPTMFNANSQEPTMFNANSQEPTMFNANTIEPTQFYGQEGEEEGADSKTNNHNGSNEGGSKVTPTSEPTIFHDVNMPSVTPGSGNEGRGGSSGAGNTPTSEPTIFFSRDTPPGNQLVPTFEPTIFSANIPAVAGQPTYEPTIFNVNVPEVAGSPTSEPTIFSANVPEVPGGTPTPTPTETSDVSIAPTNDPTQFPTPTPTEATLLGYIGESIGDVLENIF